MRKRLDDVGAGIGIEEGGKLHILAVPALLDIDPLIMTPMLRKLQIHRESGVPNRLRRLGGGLRFMARLPMHPQGLSFTSASTPSCGCFADTYGPGAMRGESAR
jgi:hypothetical protein